MDKLIDLNDRSIKQNLDTLLRDNATGKNIIWATEPPNGISCTEHQQITKSQLLLSESDVILPRMMKELDQQQERTKKKGEVFTPAWICCLMNNHLDEEWLKRTDGLFFTMHGNEWIVNPDKIEFYKGRRWQAYVDSRRLEVCCGEAPFLVSRYDASTGESLPIERRIGILDRKLRVVNEHLDNVEDWTNWAFRAFESVYGFEFQGDNLLLARLNLLYTFSEYYEHRWSVKPSDELLKEVADIIAWNLWQMDGLANTVPYGKPLVEYVQLSLFDFMDEEKEEEPITPCLVRNWRTGKKLEYKEGIKKMKFDFVIGNPPYQDETIGENKGFAPPVYDKFLTEAYKIADKVEMIHPARFLYNAGSTPKKWNEQMLSDPHLKVLYYEQDSSKVFQNTDIKGGVAVTYHDKNSDFGAIGIFTAFDELNSIKRKVLPIQKGSSIADILFTQCRFDLDMLYQDYPQYRKIIGSEGKDRRFRNNIFEKIPLFTEEKKSITDIAVLGVLKNKRVWRYLEEKYIDKSHENLAKWKVLVPRANGSGALGEVLTAPLIGEPLIGYTQTFIGIGAFNNHSEAEAAIKYIKSKFARCMLGILKITQDNDREVWRCVPSQDFTSSSDIDWSKPIPEIDQQLYRKYNLDQAEIDFIESHVKEMT